MKGALAAVWIVFVVWLAAAWIALLVLGLLSSAGVL